MALGVTEKPALSFENIVITEEDTLWIKAWIANLLFKIRPAKI